MLYNSTRYAYFLNFNGVIPMRNYNNEMSTISKIQIQIQRRATRFLWLWSLLFWISIQIYQFFKFLVFFSKNGRTGTVSQKLCLQEKSIIAFWQGQQTDYIFFWKRFPLLLTLLIDRRRRFIPIGPLCI